MLAAFFNAAAPKQLPQGTCDDGRYVYASFRPSVAQLAHLLTPHLDGISTVAQAIPFPRGMRLIRNAWNNQLQLVVAEVYARRMRRAYGFIGELKLVWFLTPLLDVGF